MQRADELLADLSPDLNCVIVGFDHSLSYPKIAKAASILARPGSIFIATNTDENWPHKDKLLLPGTSAKPFLKNEISNFTLQAPEPWSRL